MDHPIPISGKKFFAGCAVAAIAIGLIGHVRPWPVWLVAAEVLLTVISLFVFGSMKYRLDKNALTYGMAMVIAATAWGLWWPASNLRLEVVARGAGAIGPFIGKHFLTIDGLEKLVHIDTMLFILGLTFFVAVIAQTRLLETVSGWVLGKFKGKLLPTVAILTLLVAAASGILDGVSMIGLLIRTLVIILVLGRTDKEGLIYAVEVSTVITTVSGMWLAYGEPPNLIMKTNLHPHLTDGFFLRYCLPMAAASYGIVLWSLRKRLRGIQVDMSRPEALNLNNVDPQIRRAQAMGCLAFIPFIGLLVTHAVNHEVPLFVASIAGFAFAFLGIWNRPNLRQPALREAVHEYKEYLFLFPLFFAISLLEKTGFFSALVRLVDIGIETLGVAHVAYIQFIGATLLSGALDNNVVADFASKALHGLEIGTLHLFAMAQIAGYAVGGTWTHIGCAQSVVAYAFIRKEIDPRFTPLDWIKAMTGVVFKLAIAATVIIYAEAALRSWLH